MAERLVKAALLGDAPRGLARLLADVMQDVGLRLEPTSDVAAADLVFAVIARHDVVATICGVRQRGAERIVALQPIHDPQASRRALDSGASVCFALDGPLERLGFTLLSLLAQPTRPPAPTLRLGPHARYALADLRAFAARQPRPPYRISADAESLLEAAISRDWGRRLPRPFRFGAHGRREVAAMQLDLLAIERLERAVQADVDTGMGRVA